MTDYKEVSTTQDVVGHEGRVATFKITQLIWLLLGVLEGLLGLRFIFKLIGVNPGNTFATFLYNLTDFFVRPFASLTGAPAADGMVFEFSTILAMIIYALVGWALVRIIYVLFYRPRGPVSVKQTIVDQHIPAATSATSQTTTTTTEDTTNNTTDTP
jgi:uncharacterized protein YggT (Ycf19 family)